MFGPGPFAHLRQQRNLAASATHALKQWAAAAATHAETTPPAANFEHWTATVDGCPGPYGWAKTETGALIELEAVLAGWAYLKLKDGDTDIPSAGGIDLPAIQAQTGHPKLEQPRVRRSRRRG